MEIKLSMYIIKKMKIKKCKGCKNPFMYKDEDKEATHMNIYCKHLGFCNEKCFSQLARRERNEIIIKAMCDNLKNEYPESFK